MVDIHNLQNNSMIFKTFDNDIDKISAKWGIFGKSFNDIGTAISGKVTEINKNFQATDDLIGSIKNSGDSILQRLYPSKESIQSQMIDVDTLYPDLNDDNFSSILDKLVKTNDQVNSGSITWQKYFSFLNDDEKWQIKFVQNTDLQKASLDDIKEGYENARQSAIAHNKQIKAGTLSAKAATLATKAFSMALNAVATMLISWAISKVVEAIDNYVNRVEIAKEKLSETESELETVNSEIKSIAEQIDAIKSKGSLSITDEEDLDRLRAENEELRIRKRLLEMQKSEDEKQVADYAKENYEKKYGNSKYGTSRETIDNYKNKQSSEKVRLSNNYLTGDVSDSAAISFTEGESNLTRLIAEYELLAEKKANAIKSEDADAIKEYNKELDNLESELINNRTELQGFADDISLEGGDASELAEIKALLSLIDNALFSAGENLSNFINNDVSESDVEQLKLLAESGNLTADELKTNFSEVDEYLKENGLTLEDLISILGLYKDEITGIATETSKAFSKTEMISQLNNMSEGFEELDKIYSSIKDDDPFDFKLLDNTNFKETFSGLESYADFIEQITSNSDDINACQDAFDTLLTEWINSVGVLEGVTEENANLTTSMLEQMGVANAEEVVTKALATAKTNLAAQEQFLTAKKELGTIASNDLANATADEIAEIINEGYASADTKQYLSQLYFAKLDLQNLKIDTQSDIDQLIALANAARTSEEYVGALKAALSTLSSFGAKTVSDANKLANATKYSVAGGQKLNLSDEDQSSIVSATTELNSILNSIQKASLNPADYYAKSNYTGGSTSNKNNGGSSAEQTAEDFNWIERAIKKVQRVIENLSKTVSSTYKTWGTRNKALKEQISAINSEISIQQKAYDYYMKKANSIGLSSSYVQKIQDGSISIETITDENLIEAINSYQELYDQALDCKDAIDDLHESIASLYEEKFNNVASEFEEQLSLLEHLTNTYDNGLAALEAKGYLESTKYYEAMRQVEEQNIEILEKKLDGLVVAMSEAVNSGEVEKNSSAWYSMQQEINSVKEEIQEANTSLIEFNNSIRELKWEQFDYLQERISSISEEIDFLDSLLGNSDLFDDKGQMTNAGLASMGLHGVNYNTYMAQTDKYAEEVLNINKELAEDPYNTTLIERREELLELQRDAILAANDEKQAIADLVEEGINAELEALQELIDKYNEAADSAHDLYTYNKQIKELTSEISSLQKQQIALSGDTSEENRAKIQQINVKLQEAQENLEETEMEHALSETKKLLDELYLEYENILNERLDNIDSLVSDMIDTINANSQTIEETLREETEKVGYTMTEAMQSIWSNDGNANSVITKYGDNFTEQLTSVNTVLNAIAVKMGAIVAESDKEAEETVKKETSTTPVVATPNISKTPTTSTTTTTNKTTSTSTTKTVKVGGKINAGSAQIYDYVGDKSGERQYYRNDPIYTVLEERNGYLKVRHHKLSSGITGWFKKSDVKAYKTGGLVDYTGLAQLDGTPSKPELVLNSKDTENILETVDVARNMVTKGLLSELNEFNKISSISGKIPATSGDTKIGDINITIPIERVMDYNDFVNQLRADPKFEKLVQSMSVNQLFGGSKLEKNKYRWK